MRPTTVTGTASAGRAGPFAPSGQVRRPLAQLGAGPRSPCRWNTWAASVAASAAMRVAPMRARNGVTSVRAWARPVAPPRARAGRRSRSARPRTLRPAGPDARPPMPGRRAGRPRAGATLRCCGSRGTPIASAPDRSTWRPPGRSPPATSAHARPSSCSACWNGKGGSRSSSVAAASRRRLTRRRPGGGQQGQHQADRTDDGVLLEPSQGFPEPAAGRLHPA